MEEGNLAEWLYEQLEPLMDELVVLPDKHKGNKSSWRRNTVQQQLTIARRIASAVLVTVLALPTLKPTARCK